MIRRRPRPYITNGDQIRALRDRLCISQEQVAKRAGISRRYYIQLETGEKLPSAVVRDKVAEALEIDAGSVQSSDDDDEEDDPVVALTRAIHRIVQAEVARATGVAAVRERLEVEA